MSLTETQLRSQQVIAAGMGINISSPDLERAIGQASDRLGLPTMVTMSGTGAPVFVVSILQAGDPGGHYRRLLQEKPIRQMGERIIEKYYQDPEKPHARFIYPPNPSDLIGRNEARKQALKELLVCSNYAMVRRAKEGHSRPVAINLLTKIELTHLYELFGAQAAGVDVVVMGAGIPSQIPDILDRYVEQESASYKVEIANAPNKKYPMSFDPRAETPIDVNHALDRPNFVLVTSFTSLARRMHGQGKIDGVVMENYLAGGHNAPPRGELRLDARGEPIYSEKDRPELSELVKHRIPFWVAGGYSENLQEALDMGAQGIQVGTIFALAKESGMAPELRKGLLQLAYTGELDVFNNPVGSPTGYPIEIARLKNTLSDPDTYADRGRVCSLGYLVELYETLSGKVATRCPAEPIEAWLGKGGRLEDALNRLCLCNGLLASAGFGIETKSGKEPPVVTLGKMTDFVRRILRNVDDEYTAEDALNFIYKQGRFTKAA